MKEKVENPRSVGYRQIERLMRDQAVVLVGNKALRPTGLHLTLGAALFVGSVLRLWNFWVPSLWLDEFGTFWVVSPPTYAKFFYRCVHYLPTSPFYFLFVRISCACFGKNEFALRFPSVIASIVSIIALYLLAKQLVSSNSAIGAVWFFSLHPWFILQGQDARPYAFSILFSILSAVFLLRAISSDKTLDAIMFSFISGALFYTHYPFILLTVYQIGFWLWSIRGIERKRRLRQLHCLLLASSLFFIIAVPSLFQIASYSKWRGGVSHQIGFDISRLVGLITPDVTNLFFLIAAIGIVGFVLTIKSGRNPISIAVGMARRRVVFFLVWFLLPWPPYLFYWWNTGIDQLLVLRYLIIYFVPAPLLIGCLLGGIKEQTARLLTTILFVIFCCGYWFLPEYIRHRSFAPDRSEDWHGLIRFMNSKVKPETLILARCGLVDSDRMLQHGGNDPDGRSLIRAPFSGFYSEIKWNFIDLPYHWNAHYFLEEVVPLLCNQVEFWLVSRRDLELANFMQAFKKGLHPPLETACREQASKEFTGIILVHYTCQTTW